MATPNGSAPSGKSRFLLSIHDVWPGNFPLVEDNIRVLQGLGARRIALLVVPAYHGRHAVDAAPEFLAWLREKEAAGSEILLHGYHHLMGEKVSGSAATLRRSAWGRWVNRYLVGGEAEFCGLPAGERVRLLELGMALMAKAGFPARAFVAPTWHGAPPKPALKAGGVVLWEDRFRLHHLPTGVTRFAPPLAWDAPNRNARLMGGRPWLAALLRLPLFKVALHPGDFESPEARAQVGEVYTRARETGYADVF
jgi:predicted deacetylase